MAPKRQTPCVMVVAGGEWQVPLIAKAKEMGYCVINSNLHEDSAGFALADVGRVADVKDLAANLAIAREFDPDAIVTDQSDIAVPTVAYLCAQLDLPGIGVDGAHRFTDKATMRSFCRDHSFPSPRFAVCGDPASLGRFFDQCEGPIVVKPKSNQSSRGVVKVDRQQDLLAAWNFSLPFCSDGKVLAEEFIGGVELTVEGIKLPDRHVTLAVSAKDHYAHNPMVARRLLYSSHHTSFDQDALVAQHDRFIDQMDLRFGLTHTEYKYADDAFYLIETAARGGGTRVSSDVVPLMSGVDANAALLRMALGHDPGPVEPANIERHVVLEFFNFEPGVVAAIEGLGAARQLDGVCDLGVSFDVGDTLHPPTDDRSRHMYMIAHADTVGELEGLVERVREMVRVHYA